MPYINTTTNVKVSSDSEKAIKTQFGEAIKILGKSEGWLMLNFSDNQRMYFQGDNSKPIAMVEVEIFGKASASAYSQMTTAITDILSKELSIEPSQIYVKYEEISTWGWNGNNF
jgi:phenylpyruvate tautomerase PptA (4-oxalocrotonate tautomerase family)